MEEGSISIEEYGLEESDVPPDCTEIRMFDGHPTFVNGATGQPPELFHQKKSDRMRHAKLIKNMEDVLRRNPANRDHPVLAENRSVEQIYKDHAPPENVNELL